MLQVLKLDLSCTNNVFVLMYAKYMRVCVVSFTYTLNKNNDSISSGVISVSF